MTDLEKKAEEYLENKSNWKNGETCVQSIRQAYKDGYKQGQLLSNSLQLKSTTEKNSEVKELKTLADNRQLFIDWVFEHYPDVAQEYLNQQK